MTDPQWHNSHCAETSQSPLNHESWCDNCGVRLRTEDGGITDVGLAECQPDVNLRAQRNAR